MASVRGQEDALLATGRRRPRPQCGVSGQRVPRTGKEGGGRNGAGQGRPGPGEGPPWASRRTRPAGLRPRALRALPVSRFALSPGGLFQRKAWHPHVRAGPCLSVTGRKFTTQQTNISGSDACGGSMTAQTFLGIDAGGTHTDAVLCGPEGILAGAKAPTYHEDLPSSVRAALAALEKALEEKFGPEGSARLRDRGHHPGRQRPGAGPGRPRGPGAERRAGSGARPFRHRGRCLHPARRSGPSRRGSDASGYPSSSRGLRRLEEEGRTGRGLRGQVLAPQCRA